MKYLALLPLATVVVLTGCSLVGIRTEESPRYQVIETTGNIEVRTYAPRIVAKTSVPGNFTSAQKKGFKLLADYIFGKNEKQEKISMTAPVTQSAPKNEKIEMTAPVMMTQTGASQVMTFTMPRKYTLDSLPKPLDPQVVLERIPAQTYGVIRFSGVWREETNQIKAKELVDWINQKGQYEVISEPIFAGYNPPWTLSFFRRNEVLLELRRK